MRIKFLKAIYLDKNYILPGTEMNAIQVNGEVLVEYSTCCSVGTRVLELDEYQIVENETT